MKRDCTVIVKRFRRVSPDEAVPEIVQLSATIEWGLLVEDISRDMADYLCSSRAVWSYESLPPWLPVVGDLPRNRGWYRIVTVEDSESTSHSLMAIGYRS